MTYYSVETSHQNEVNRRGERLEIKLNVEGNEDRTSACLLCRNRYCRVSEVGGRSCYWGIIDKYSVSQIIQYNEALGEGIA